MHVLESEKDFSQAQAKNNLEAAKLCQGPIESKHVETILVLGVLHGSAFLTRAYLSLVVSKRLVLGHFLLGDSNM